MHDTTSVYLISARSKGVPSLNDGGTSLKILTDNLFPPFEYLQHLNSRLGAAKRRATGGHYALGISF